MSYFVLFFFYILRRPPRSTLFLHDALPISHVFSGKSMVYAFCSQAFFPAAEITWPTCSLLPCLREEGTRRPGYFGDRKSTRLNSSHRCISYAVFCLKKKKNILSETEIMIDV